VKSSHLGERRLGRHVGNPRGRPGGSRRNAHRLARTGSLAQHYRTLGADGLGLRLFDRSFFSFRCMGGWKHQRNAHNKETKKLKERIHCCAAAMVHQSAPNGKRCRQCTELKKVAQDQQLARLFNKVSEL
jgi:hypothetical protein